LGGLARKATIIDQLDSDNINPIILDSGNLFFKKNTTDPGITLETAMINAEIIVESFNKIGCHAFSPGSQDFGGGFDYLMDLRKKANFDFISSNIILKFSKNELLFKPYKIINFNGKKIALIGLTSKFESNDIDFIEPSIALEKTLSQIENQFDISILLFNATEQDLNLIYDKNFNIDLIIKSKGRTRSNDGGSNIPTFIAGDRGKLLYKFELNLKDKLVPFVDIAWCNNTIARVESRLNKMKKGDLNIDLFELYKNDIVTLNRINNYLSQKEEANNLLSNAINTMTFEKIELGKNIYDKPSILKIVDKGKIRIQDLQSLPLTQPINSPDAGFPITN